MGPEAMTLTRIQLWRGPFEALIDDIKAKPFVWGENDCGPALAGRMVEALTGQDLCGEYRGRYRSRRGALKLMREAGFDDLADLVATKLPEIHISQATVGDIAAIPVDTPFRHALGVVNGERVFVLTANGIGTVDLFDAARAFKVG